MAFASQAPLCCVASTIDQAGRLSCGRRRWRRAAASNDEPVRFGSQDATGKPAKRIHCISIITIVRGE